MFGRSTSNAEKPAVVSKPPPKIRRPKKTSGMVKLKNQDRCYDDGLARLPLLDPLRHDRYAAYIKSYADLLSIWGFDLLRCELLKHTTNSVRKPVMRGKTATPTIRVEGLANQDVPNGFDNPPLQLRRICARCGSTTSLKPNTSCEACKVLDAKTCLARIASARRMPVRRDAAAPHPGTTRRSFLKTRNASAQT